MGRIASIHGLPGAACAAALLLTGPGAALAGSDASLGRGPAVANTNVGFTVRVPRLRQVEARESPKFVDITPEDLVRGEKDVPGSLRIVSNARDGSLLRVAVESPAFSDVAIEGLEFDVRTSGGNAQVRVPSMVGKAWPLARSVVYRAKLAPGIAPGRYPFPVRFALE